MADTTTRLFETPSATGFEFTCHACPESTSDPERQIGYEVAFVRRGRFGVHRSGRRFDVDSRCIVLTNAGKELVFSHGRTAGDACTVFRIAPPLVDEARSRYWTRESGPDPTMEDVLFPRLILRRNPVLDYLHVRLSESTNSGADPLRTDDLVVDLLTTLFSTLHDRDERFMPAARLHPEVVASLERAARFIHANFSREQSLSKIADEAGLSTFHFSRLFREYTGVSPYRYVVEIRLQHASRLLRDTGWSVTQTALDSGFNSLSHFSDAFARRFGKSPTAYRADL